MFQVVCNLVELMVPWINSSSQKTSISFYFKPQMIYDIVIYPILFDKAIGFLTTNRPLNSPLGSLNAQRSRRCRAWPKISWRSFWWWSPPVGWPRRTPWNIPSSWTANSSPRRWTMTLPPGSCERNGEDEVLFGIRDIHVGVWKTLGSWIMLWKRV